VHAFLTFFNVGSGDNEVAEAIREAVHAEIGRMVRVVEHCVPTSCCPRVLAAIGVALEVTIPSENPWTLVSLEPLNLTVDAILNYLTLGYVLGSEHSETTKNWVWESHSAFSELNRGLSRSRVPHMLPDYIRV